MRLHRGAVDQHLSRRSARSRERMEEIAPNALRSPADEAVVERLVRAIEAGRINPAPARFDDVNDPADHPPIKARLRMWILCDWGEGVGPCIIIE